MRKYLKGSIPRADNVVRMASAGRKSCDWLLTGQECRSVVEARDYGTPGARWAHDSIDMIIESKDEILLQALNASLIGLLSQTRKPPLVKG
jgi:hypothetical protein